MRGGYQTNTPVIDVSALLTALSSAVTAGDIVTLFASIVGVCLPFMLIYFGARTVISMFSSALTTGRLSIGAGRRRR